MSRNRMAVTAAALFAVVVGFLAIGLMFSGCGKKTSEKDAIVAEVAGRPIELREITDFLTAIQIDYPTAAAEREARQKQLDRLIEEKLLVIGAYSRSLDADIGIIELVDREKDKFLLDELFRREVIEKVRVPEEAIREVYSHWFDRVQPLHILVSSKSQADSILEQLQAGADFGDMAEKHSIDRTTAVRGGDLGRAFRWGELIGPLQELAFSLNEGETGGPVESEFGWHIVRVKSRYQVEKQPLEQLWTPIESSLRRKMQEQRRREQLDDLRRRANIQLHPDAWATLRDQVRTIADTTPAPPGTIPEIPVDSFSDSQKNLTFATYGGDSRVTLEQVARSINARPREGRPDVEDEDQMKEFVFQMRLYDLLREEALRLQLDQSPLYKERLLEFQEKLMADKMHGNLISRNLKVTEDDVRAFYEANPDSFSEPTAYRVREVLVNDEESAQKILREAKRGTPLADLAKRYTTRPGFKKNGGDLGWVRPNRYGDLYEPASRLKPGEIAGPVAGVGQYSIIQLLEVQPSRQRSYVDVKGPIFDHIQKQRGDSIIQAYIDSMKVLFPVVVHEDVLNMNLRATGTAKDTAGRG